MLRLGKVNDAITNLEDMANIQLVTIAGWDMVAPPDEKTRKARDGFLTAVKTYQDELRRFADFHALRYTWATFLQRNGVAQRFAMNLMRHSDIKLTAKVYTDEMQLPVYDSIKSLPRLG